jgi:hypothetical protein
MTDDPIFVILTVLTVGMVIACVLAILGVMHDDRF